MGLINDFFVQSQLALAAYANLLPGSPSKTALIDAGMSDSQATLFARDWRVVEQYTHTEQTPIYDDGGNITGYLTTSNGLTVTVFQEVETGKRYLSIRGTEATSGSDLWTDLKDLVAIGTPEHQSQYQSLKAKITEWQGDGTLPASFTVAGHSLGGFLAAAVAIDFPLNVEHAYLYNAPGAGGVRANLEQAIQTLNGLPYGSRTLDLGIVSNLRAASGASLIAGLGEAWSTPLGIEIEAASGLGLDNHSIVRLTDALAVHAAYAELAPSLTLAQTGQIFRSASERNTNSLEAALDALRTTLTGSSVTPTSEEDRDALHRNLKALQDSAEYKALKGSAAVRLTATQDASTLVSKAKSDFGYFLSVKYLLPVAIEGAASAIIGAHADLHTQWQADQTNRAAGSADLTFTDEYLADRAAFLTWKNHLALRDKSAAAAPYTDAPDAWFRDYASGLVIHLGAILTDSTAKPRYLFGADQSSGTEVLEGGTNADRIYGGGGVDHLYGYGGNDRLEGGAGDDELYGGGEDDTLIGGRGDDILRGGTGFDTYIVGQGTDTIVDEDGLGVVRDGQGRVIAGAFVQGADGRYTWIQNAQVGATHNSPLTITLENGAQVIIENYDDFDGGVLGIDLIDAPAPVDYTRLIQGDRQWQVFHAPAELEEGSSPLPGGGPLVPGAEWIVTLNHPVNPQDPAWANWRIEQSDAVLVDQYDYLGWTVKAYRLSSATWAYNRIDELGNYLTTEQVVAADDRLYGSAGNDRLLAGEGDDEVEAMAGADRAELGSGDDHARGGEGADTLVGGAGRDVLFGEGGDDILHAHAERDPLAAFDLGQSQSAQDGESGWLDGGEGDDRLIGVAGADVLLGGTGGDLILGGGGDDHLAGDDIIGGQFSAGEHIIFGYRFDMTRMADYSRWLAA